MLTEPGRPVVLDGRYELVGQLGRGGMGTVHQAVDHRLLRTVAVKLLSEELAYHPASRERFQREAHAVATLNHPSIATIYDVAERRIGVDPQPYLVMEYVDGVTLAELQRAGEFPVEQAVAVACQVLDALEHSHRNGIVHRDIKPSNIREVAAHLHLSHRTVEHHVSSVMCKLGLASRAEFGAHVHGQASEPPGGQQ